MTSQIRFDCTPAESATICQIVDRAVKLGIASKNDRLGLTMDMVATHSNGCPMDFERLLAADDMNFVHDIKGIERHLDRDDASPTGGQLLDCFLPRFAKPEAARAA